MWQLKGESTMATVDYEYLKTNVIDLVVNIGYEFRSEAYRLVGYKTGVPSIDRNHEDGSKFFERHPFIPGFDIATILKSLSKDRLDDWAIDCDELRVTYRQLEEDWDKMYYAFKNLGIKKGDIVTIALNDYHGLVAWLGLNQLGAAATFIDTYSTRDEIKYFLDFYNSPLFIGESQSLDDCDYYLKNSGVNRIINLRSENENSRNYSLYDATDESIIDFHSLGKYAEREPKKLYIPFPNRGKNLALILYTSGSSGELKAVPLTNEKIMAAQIYAGKTSHTENITSTKTIVCVPMRYPYGFSTSLLTSLLWGKEAVLAARWSKATAAYYINKKPQIYFGSPAVDDVCRATILEEEKRLGKTCDLSHISHFISGGDFYTVERAEAGYKFFEERGNTDVEIGNGCGNAENASLCSTPVGVPLRQETAGKVLNGTVAMIISEDIPDEPIKDSRSIKELGYGEIGELCVSGKNVFDGYYNNPEKSSKVLFKKDGRVYMRTGTLGYLTQEGYLVVTGKKSRFYIRDTGHKVYLDNIQNGIYGKCSDIVSECAAVQLDDPDERYIPIAYVVLKDGILPTEDVKRNINDILSFSLKEYEIPRHIFFIDELPRIPGAEKVDYLALEAQAAKDVEHNKRLKK